MATHFGARATEGTGQVPGETAAHCHRPSQNFPALTRTGLVLHGPLRLLNDLSCLVHQPGLAVFMLGEHAVGGRGWRQWFVRGLSQVRVICPITDQGVCVTSTRRSPDNSDSTLTNPTASLPPKLLLLPTSDVYRQYPIPPKHFGWSFISNLHSLPLCSRKSHRLHLEKIYLGSNHFFHLSCFYLGQATVITVLKNTAAASSLLSLPCPTLSPQCVHSASIGILVKS